MVTDGAPDEELHETLRHLTAEARKARALNNDLRIAALHAQMDAIVAELLARGRRVTLGVMPAFSTPQG